MARKYDLVIVGAGPAGAMAAKTAGENGLKTAILERKTNPAEITRGCAQMFLFQDGGFEERMYYNKKNRKIIFPVNGFTVNYDGPTRNFYAWHLYAPDGKTRLEFGDYQNIKKGDEGRFSFVYDKGKLIDGLMKEAVKNGVDVFTGVNVNGVEKTAERVRVTGNGDIYEGTFVIGADGRDSRVGNLMGFYKERKFYGGPPGISYYVTGLNIPQSEAAITPICFKPNALLPTVFWIIPSPYAEDEYWLAVRSVEDFEYVTKKSVFSKWFHDVRVTRSVRSYIYSLWTPVDEPYKDNVLLAGDAPWFAEAEITGSVMCGWKAANAVTVALRDNKPEREGVIDYIEWWKKSFPEHEDYRNMFLYLPFTLLFSEEELILLYSLIKKPLRASINPCLAVGIFKQALEPMMSQIEKEMPSAAEKLKMLHVDNVDKILAHFKNLKKKVSEQAPSYTAT